MVAARHSLGRALSYSRASLYVCRSCRHQLSRTGLSIQQQRFASRASPTRGNEGAQSSQIDEPSSLRNRYGTSNTIEKQRAQRQANEPGTELISEEEYIPAETWEGLQYVGSSGDWRDTPSQPGDEFQSWSTSASTVASNRDQLVSCLHQALVECLTYAQAGLDPNDSFRLDYTKIDGAAADMLASAEITLAQTGAPAQVQFIGGSNVQEVVEVLETPVVSSEADGEQNQEYTQSGALFYTVRNESFLSLQLSAEDPLAFTILKRFSFLSGHRIPDPILSALLSTKKPLSFLVERLLQVVVQPKPKKVADILLGNPVLANQKNVMIFPRRETSVDREKEVGRWKVIEKELQDRGLPALGRLKHL